MENFNTAIMPESFYFHGQDAEQFIFVQVPILLIKSEIFRGISDGAKLLYGLLLNRTGLSIKSGWTDDKGRVYINYTIESLCADMGIGVTKAKKLFSELTDINKTGVGLIRKERVLNKPSRIYVMNFMEVVKYLAPDEAYYSPSDEIKGEENDLEFKKTPSKATEIQDSRKCVPPSAVNATDGQPQMRPTDSRECDPPTAANATLIKNNNIKQDYINIDYYKNQSINQSYTQEPTAYTHDTKDDRWMDEIDSYRALIRKNILYDEMISSASLLEQPIWTEIYECICDVVAIKRNKIRINGAEYPYEIVKSVFLKLNSRDVEYAVSKIKNIRNKVKNMRAYLIALLYNLHITQETENLVDYYNEPMWGDDDE